MRECLPRETEPQETRPGTRTETRWLAQIGPRVQSPAPHKPGLMAHTCNLSLGGEGKKIWIQVHAWLHSKLKTSLEYVGPCLRKIKERKNRKPLSAPLSAPWRIKTRLCTVSPRQPAGDAGSQQERASLCQSLLLSQSPDIQANMMNSYIYTLGRFTYVTKLLPYLLSNLPTLSSASILVQDFCF